MTAQPILRDLKVNCRIATPSNEALAIAPQPKWSSASRSPQPMPQTLHTADYIVFLVYFLIVAGYGCWIYTKKKVASASSKDYFLAEGALTWWAIGASLIASNISAEQMIGMSGSGFKMGLAIATYEWLAAATLLIVAVFFMPVFW
jgi:hypothetical protein